MVNPEHHELWQNCMSLYDCYRRLRLGNLYVETGEHMISLCYVEDLVIDIAETAEALLDAHSMNFGDENGPYHEQVLDWLREYEYPGDLDKLGRLIDKIADFVREIHAE